jgi:membrane protease YdiL (CAAX protease family)
MDSTGQVIFGTALLIGFGLIINQCAPVFLFTRNLNRDFQWEFLVELGLVIYFFRPHFSKVKKLRLTSHHLFPIAIAGGLGFLFSWLSLFWNYSPTGFGFILRNNFLNACIVLGIGAPLLEEFVFREVLFESSDEHQFGILTSFLFALAHMPFDRSIISLPVLFLLGYFFYRTRKRLGLTAAVLAHSTYNSTLMLTELALQ